MCSIAQHDQTGAHLFLRLDQHKRIKVPRANLSEPPKPIAERLLQLLEKLGFRGCGKTRGIPLRASPDESATVIRQRQQRHRSFICETLERAPAVGGAGRYIGDQRRLPIRRLFDLDTEVLAQP